MLKSSLLRSILVLLWLSANVQADEIMQSVPLTEVSVSAVAGGAAEFAGEEIQFPGQSGEPSIPFQVVRLLLPPEADLSTVAVSLENQRIEEVAGEWDVSPIPPESFWDGSQVIETWPTDKNIMNRRDNDIYSADRQFPADWVGSVTPGQMREWLLVEITVATYKFNPIQKALYRLVEGELVVTYAAKISARSLRLPVGTDTIARGTVSRITVNFAEVAPAYQAPATRFILAEPRNTYAIITTHTIASGSSELGQFIASKESRGFDVQVITEDMWGGGTGDTAAENIRRWLQNNYLSQNIEYVLLIGNPDPLYGDVPMKMLWPRSNYTTYRESPSDYYFADLTGNWDLDEDGLFGELEDFGIGGVDRNWEVLVGRIPFYGSISDLDHILAKIRSYENTNQDAASWRNNVLLPMKPSDIRTPGYHLGEAINNDAVLPRGWGFHRIYDEDYGLYPPPETTPTTVDNVANVWSTQPFGAAFWWTHGSITSASSIMNITAAQRLNDAFPAFTFQASCHNAWPERSYNLAYELLRNGSIATVGATRVSWYYPGQTRYADSPSNAGMTYEYAKRLITSELDSGHALYEMKQALTRNIWMNFTVFNVYGDPSVGLFTTGDQKLTTVIEAESMALSGGYAVEDNPAASGRQLIRRLDSGGNSATAITQYTGPTGTYDIAVSYFDENDGRSNLGFVLNGQMLDQWIADEDPVCSDCASPGASTMRMRVVARDIRLSPGDEIVLQGTGEHYEYARFDKITIAPASAMTFEAENMALEGGYAVESNVAASGGKLIRRLASGGYAATAKTEFAGPAGAYDIAVSYFDENDGMSNLALLVNGQVLDQWIADEDPVCSDCASPGASTLRTRVAANKIHLQPGDEITLQGTGEHYEYARFDKITVSPVNFYTLEAERMNLDGRFWVEDNEAASGGQIIRAGGPPDSTPAQANAPFMSTKGTYNITVTYFDEYDGISSMAFFLNNQRLDQWLADENPACAVCASPNEKTLRSRVVARAVEISSGDEIRLESTVNQYEYGRFDKIDFERLLSQ